MELKNIEVKTLPATNVACVLHTGPFQGNSELYMRLIGQIHAWAGARGLMTPTTGTFAIYPDDPSIVDVQKQRLYVGVPVPPDTKVDDEVSMLELVSAQYVVASFELLPQEFNEAWCWLFDTWFPENGHRPDNSKPGFEWYPAQQPQDGSLVVDICVAIKGH